VMGIKKDIISETIKINSISFWKNMVLFPLMISECMFLYKSTKFSSLYKMLLLIFSISVFNNLQWKEVWCFRENMQKSFFVEKDKMDFWGIIMYSKLLFLIEMNFLFADDNFIFKIKIITLPYP